MSNTLSEEVDNTTSEITAQEQLDIDALGFGFYKNDPAPTEVSSITATEQSEEEYEELTAEEQEDINALGFGFYKNEQTTSSMPTEYDSDADTGIEGYLTRESLAELTEDTQLSVDFFSTPAMQTSIKYFMEDRYGKLGAKEEGETKGDYAQRFFSKMRWMENNFASTGMGLSYLYNADEKQKDNFAALYAAYADMPSFYEEGGQSSWNVITDSIFASVVDPTNVATLGASMGLKLVGGRMAARTLLATAIRSNAGKIAGAVGAEGIIGAMHESTLQAVQVESKLRTEKDWNSIMAAGVLSGTFAGGINLAALKWGAKDITYADKLKSRVLAAGTPDSDKLANQNIVDSLQGMQSLFDATYARGVTDDLGEATDMLQMGVTPEVMREANQVVEQLQIAIPEFRRKGDEKISDAMYRVWDAMALGIDDVEVGKLLLDSNNKATFELAKNYLDKTLKKNNVSYAELSEVTRFTLNQSSKVLLEMKYLAAAERKLSQLDPEVLDYLAQPKAADIANAELATKILPSLYEPAKKWDRIRRAILTSQPVTSMRNALSASTYITFDMGAELLINTAEGLGKAFRAVGEGNMSVAGTLRGTKDIFTDSTRLISRLYDTGVTREISEAILEGHTDLHQILLRTTQEAGNNSLPKVVRMLNGLNIAQDQFIRSAVFVESIERQLKGSGTDVMSVLASQKKMPTDVVKKAVDDALQATFADVPKGGVASKFVALVETFPFAPVIGTAAFPFARFMASAMSFQYRFSPLSVFGQVRRLNVARAHKRNGTTGAEFLSKKAKREFAESTVGSAALMSAIYYRAENRDLPVNEVRMGDKDTPGGVDISAFFPLPFYLAAGELMYQAYANTLGDGDDKSIDWGTTVQGLTGAQFRASQFDSYTENIKNAISDSGLGVDGIAGEKAAEATGKFIGEMLGQYATPARVIRDILGAFDEEHNIVKDPKVLSGQGAMERGMESLTNQAKKNIPFLSSDLPDQVSTTRTTTTTGEDGEPVRVSSLMRRESPVLLQMTGMKSVTERTAIEKELMDRGVPLYTLAPKKGDSQYDAAMKQSLAPFIEDILGPVFESEEYKAMTNARKKVKISNLLKEVKLEASEPAQSITSSKIDELGYDPVDRARWDKTSRDRRASINEDSMALFGKSIEERKAYGEGAEDAKELKDL